MTVKAICLGLILLAAPFLMYSQEVRTFCKDHGATQVPLAEEEEAHGLSLFGGMDRSGPMIRPAEHGNFDPYWDEEALCSFHGDVPHHPPWS